jgi:hypothetical protein
VDSSALGLGHASELPHPVDLQGSVGGEASLRRPPAVCGGAKGSHPPSAIIDPIHYKDHAK